MKLNLKGILIFAAIIMLSGIFSVTFASAGCYNNNNCTYHAYKLCSGNNVYWFDSCGNQQDLIQTCSGYNMVCQYGNCASSYTPAPTPNPTPINNYIFHYSKKCYTGNVYWYDSNGQISGLYKNCSTSNSCMQSSCQAGKCNGALKCDGSTCSVGSDDYNKYCNTQQQNNPQQNNNQTQKPGSLSIAFFEKENSNNQQWQKSGQVGANGTVYFMVSVTNNSSVQADNVSVFANIPMEISSLGNVKVDGIQVSGDIISGINIGSISPQSLRTITFEGKTDGIAANSNKQATITISSQNTSNSDTVSLNFSPNNSSNKSVASMNNSTQTSSGFWGFIKRWYLWILVGLVLLFLFIVVFRRLSSPA